MQTLLPASRPPSFFLLPSKWAGVPGLWPHPGRAPVLSAPVPAALPHPRPADLILCWQLPAKVMHWLKHPLLAPSAPSHRRVLVFLLRWAQALWGARGLSRDPRGWTHLPVATGSAESTEAATLAAGWVRLVLQTVCLTLTLVTQPWRVPRKG